MNGSSITGNIFQLHIYLYVTVLGTAHLKILLEKSRRLQCLNVSYNKIGSDGVKYIKDGLKQNDTLIELNISGCGVKGMHIIL